MDYENNSHISWEEISVLSDKRVENTPLSDREEDIVTEALLVLSKAIE